MNELKTKLQEIEFIQQVAPEDLREEYETQIENIHKLRMLYEERALATRIQHQRELDTEKAKTQVLEVKLSDLQEDINELQEKRQKYEDKIKELEEASEENKNEIIDLQDKLDSSRLECKSLTSQMQLINNLFSQALVGPEMDLDRLTRLLQDNHGLITDLTAKGDINDIGALLLDLASQAESENTGTISELSDSKSSNKASGETLATQQEIASNLSQVWRVLVELLSHHKNKNPNNVGGSESCYKSVDTPSGPRLVISVSKTFLTLKDLILEKKSLVKEVGRLKTLNGHLENRLDVQERRLSVVSTELKKTWGLVSKLRQQHKQLHTQEKILRYELQHKRYMLTELKQELEHCREKWEKAREKNTQSEEDWKQLRKEFALRKARQESNSAESGYEEDESGQSSPSEVNEPIHSNNETEPDDDVEHSDGNSYDTVIDLLDISCLENEEVDQIYLDTVANENVQSLPLNNDELCEGLQQIESAELAAELGLTTYTARTDYSSSFPSSSISSPIPTETDETVSSSDPDISEDDSVSNVVSAQHSIHYTSSPVTIQQISQNTLLFGSNSAQNIARFLDGLNIPDESHIPEPPTSNNTNEQTSQPLDLAKESCDLTCDGASFHSDNIPSITVSPIIQENYAVQLCLHFEEEHVDDATSSCLQNYVSVNNVQEDNPVITEKKISCGVCLVDNTATTTSYVQTNPVAQTIPESEETQEDLILRLKTLAKTNTAKDKKTTDSPNNGGNIHPVPEQSTNDNTAAEIKRENTPPETEPPKKRTQEEILEARAARLKRMEEQCKSLFSKMSATSHRSDMIASKLDELHEQYGPKEDSPEIQTVSSTAAVVPIFDQHEAQSTCESKNQTISEQSINESKTQLEKQSGTERSKSECIEPTKNTQMLSSATTMSEINSQQCTASNNIVSQRQVSKCPQEILDARAIRLTRLEDQCKSLFSKMSTTSQRSDQISNHLDKLHNQYGPSDSLPDSTQERLHKTWPTEITDKQVTVCDIPSQSSAVITHLELPNERDGQNNSTIPENSTDVKTECLKNIEEECKTLFRKVSDTKHKSETLTIKFDGLHEMNGDDNESSHPSTSEDATSSVMVENDGLNNSSSSDQNN